MGGLAFPLCCVLLCILHHRGHHTSTLTLLLNSTFRFRDIRSTAIRVICSLSFLLLISMLVFLLHDFTSGALLLSSDSSCSGQQLRTVNGVMRAGACRYLAIKYLLSPAPFLLCPQCISAQVVFPRNGHRFHMSSADS